MDVEALIVLQARMRSIRLPGKMAATIGRRTLLSHCVARLAATGCGPIVLATTVDPEDDVLVREAERLGVDVLRGAHFDVLSRFADAARRTGAEFVIRATGDNPAVDIGGARRTLDALVQSGGDYCCEHGLPYGTAVEGIRRSVLLDAHRRATSACDREHVTTFVRGARGYRLVELAAPESVRRPDLRLTIDTPRDLAYMRSVVRQLDGSLSDAPLECIIAAADRVGRRERVA